MKQSIKAVQSELGVTGDVSCNSELILTIREELADKFVLDEAQQSILEKYDSVLFIANLNLGKEVSGNQPMALCAYHGGDPFSIVMSIAQLIQKSPQFIQLFADAIQMGQQLIIEDVINKRGGKHG